MAFNLKDALARGLAAVNRRARPLSWVLLALGLAAFLLLPLASKPISLDEKSLMVGGAELGFRRAGAGNTVQAAYHQALVAAAAGEGFEAVVRGAAAALSPNYTLRLHRLAFPRPEAAASDTSKQEECHALHAVVRARHASGAEGFALLLPLDAGAAPEAAALAAAIGVTAAQYLSTSGWLAKDVAVVFLDAACGLAPGAKAWLGAHNDDGPVSPGESFPRAGLLQQAFCMEIGSAAPTHAWIALHGAGGRLPNLDMYGLLRRSVEVFVPGMPIRLAVGSALAGAAAPLLPGPRLSPAEPPSGFAGRLATAAAFAARQAAGPGDGAHAPILSAGVDAVTLRLTGPSTAAGAPLAGAMHALSILESVARSLNNLEEHLHHATPLFLLTAADRSVSVAAYLAAPAILLLALLAQFLDALQGSEGATAAGWQRAWARVALAHGAAWLAALAWHRSSHPSREEGEAVEIRQAAVAVVAAAAAAWQWAGGLASLLAGPAGAGKGGGDGSVACTRACTRAAAIIVLAAEAAALLLVRWPLCYLLLAAAVPTVALARREAWSPGAAGALRAAPLLALAWLCRHLTAGGPLPLELDFALAQCAACWACCYLL